MLSKQYRMKRNSDFNYVFKKGQSFPSKYVIFYYSKSKSTTPKIGLVVSKKIGNAVVRNKVKRLFRASLENYQEKIVPNVNLIYIVRTGVENLTFKEINNYVSLTLNKNKLLKEN